MIVRRPRCFCVHTHRAEPPVDEELVSDLEAMVEAPKGEIERLSARPIPNKGGRWWPERAASRTPPYARLDL